ncbi:hypothetical protein [Limosilactobacillus pulli]|uniref:hypothetical protein n=1 Tax=Limosilactobacillus pulli TaxID=2991833 RepID=UPI0024BA4D2C|nr:hypothetical protein [Limosilactobacillus pulli]
MANVDNDKRVDNCSQFGFAKLQFIDSSMAVMSMKSERFMTRPIKVKNVIELREKLHLNNNRIGVKV